MFFSFESSQSLTPDMTLLRVARRAMATQFEVILPAEMENGLAAANEALDLIDDLETQLTVYRDDSEISEFNRRAAFEDIPVEPNLFQLLSHAAYLTHATRGAFDVAAGALIKTWGFYQRSGRVPSVAERSEAMRRTGMRHVILNTERQTIRYRREGLEINLGAIGKGYALDRAGAMLRRQWAIRSGLLHGGTSSVLALGVPPNAASGWRVSLKHPWEKDREIGTVYLRDQALGTSAATYQFFEYNGRKLGHLLDPRKGWPAEGLSQVSVIAPTAAEADALSTAFFVMGLAETRLYCDQHPQIGAVILTPDSPEPVTVNLPPGVFVKAPA